MNLKEAKAFIKSIKGIDSISSEQQVLLDQANVIVAQAKAEKEDPIMLNTLDSLKDADLKKKKDLDINKLQMRSVLSAYKRTRDTAIQFEEAAKHGNDVLFNFLGDAMRTTQDNCLKVLANYASSTYLGNWLSKIHGVGPVVAAMLVCEIDPEKQRGKQASHLISFAGYNPMMRWGKGEKRPFNAELKLAFYYFAACQLKMMNNPNNYYGRKILKPHIEDSWSRNLKGGYTKAAFDNKDSCDKNTQAWAFYNGCYQAKDVAYIRGLAEKQINEDGVILDSKKVGAYTLSLYEKYKGAPGSGTPMLPPAHMLQRSMRFLIVVFINHLYEIMTRFELGATEYKHIPYIMTTMGGHDPISYLPAPHECEEYLSLNPNAKLDMSKMSPQHLKAWLYGEDSVWADPMNFMTDKSLETLDTKELIELQAKANEREVLAVERALYDKTPE